MGPNQENSHVLLFLGLFWSVKKKFFFFFFGHLGVKNNCDVIEGVNSGGTAVKYRPILPQFWPSLAILWLVVYGILMHRNQPKNLQY